MIPKAVKRFLKYSLIGGVTFLLDLAILYVLVHFASVNYVLASGLGFIIGVSINYLLSRKFVFKGSARALRTGYANFLLIAGVGLLGVTSGMYVLVGLLGLNYLVSRIGIAVVVGFWNYTLNLFVNFKVAGKH